MYSSRMTRIVTLAKRLTTPLLPDDYLTLFNPLLTFDSYRARVSQVTEEMPGVRTLQLQTVRALPPFTCGQHIRVGIDLNGVRRDSRRHRPPRTAKRGVHASLRTAAPPRHDRGG